MKRDQRDSRISHTWRRAALTHELAVLPDVCVAFQAPPPLALRLERMTCLGEPIDDVLIDQIMVLLLSPTPSASVRAHARA